MATGQVSAGYAIGGQAKVRHNYPTPSRPRGPRQRKSEMKLTLKQRLRNWLNDDDSNLAMESPQYVQEDKLQSDGVRLNIYKASGGYVVETRSYDSKTDRNRNSLHVITDEGDLGDGLAKIVMIEALQR